jgi:hypothetical protein
MPPVRTAINPYDGSLNPWVFRDDDLFGWQILEIEEEYQLRKGLENIGRQVIHHISRTGPGSFRRLPGNPIEFLNPASPRS